MKQNIWWQGIAPDIATLNGLGYKSMQAVLGIEVTDVTGESLTGRMPVDHRTHQPWGRLHGGASVALAETIGTLAAIHTVDPAHFTAVGMEINANHLRPVRDGYVYAAATPEARGRSSQVWTIRITDEDDKLVCISRFTLAVIPLERA